jgi:dipeptidase D
MSIQHLSPTSVWKNFYAITQIPHPSGSLQKMTDFIVQFGNNLQLETTVDDAGNILIRKPATKGKEACPTIVLQAHMDMVPQKNGHIKHDFETDPLDVYIDGDWVKARNTTLGADNGIGMAAALAVLESKDIAHPALEVLLTSDEETGMFGALGLKKDLLKGNILLNLDSEEEGELFVGCSGGVDANITFPYTAENVPHGNIALKINLNGLLGGHSGLDIEKGRANANKLIFRFLKSVVEKNNAHLAFISGGNLHNAIPREAVAIIVISTDEKENILNFAKQFETTIRSEFEGIESGLSFTIVETDLPTSILPIATTNRLITGVLNSPNGVINFITEMPTVVETSSNLSVIQSFENKIEIQCLLRISSSTKQQELCAAMKKVFLQEKAQVEFVGEYPGWQPNWKSPILAKTQEVYNNLFGKNPAIKVIHAGLECGIIGAAYPNMDMISFGPTIVSPHSPDEKVNIESVSKCWKYLMAILESF